MIDKLWIAVDASPYAYIDIIFRRWDIATEVWEMVY